MNNGTLDGTNAPAETVYARETERGRVWTTDHEVAEDWSRDGHTVTARSSVGERLEGIQTLVVAEERNGNIRRRRYHPTRSDVGADARYIAERFDEGHWVGVGSDRVDELIVNGVRVFDEVDSDGD